MRLPRWFCCRFEISPVVPVFGVGCSHAVVLSRTYSSSLDVFLCNVFDVQPSLPLIDGVWLWCAVQGRVHECVARSTGFGGRGLCNGLSNRSGPYSFLCNVGRLEAFRLVVRVLGGLCVRCILCCHLGSAYVLLIHVLRFYNPCCSPTPQNGIMLIMRL